MLCMMMFVNVFLLVCLYTVDLYLGVCTLYVFFFNEIAL